jgi:hypothetical protein
MKVRIFKLTLLIIFIQIFIVSNQIFALAVASGLKKQKEKSPEFVQRKVADVGRTKSFRDKLVKVFVQGSNPSSRIHTPKSGPVYVRDGDSLLLRRSPHSESESSTMVERSKRSSSESVQNSFPARIASFRETEEDKAFRIYMEKASEDNARSRSLQGYEREIGKIRREEERQEKKEQEEKKEQSDIKMKLAKLRMAANLAQTGLDKYQKIINKDKLKVAELKSVLYRANKELREYELRLKEREENKLKEIERIVRKREERKIKREKGRKEREKRRKAIKRMIEKEKQQRIELQQERQKRLLRLKEEKEEKERRYKEALEHDDLLFSLRESQKYTDKKSLEAKLLFKGYQKIKRENSFQLVEVFKLEEGTLSKRREKVGSVEFYYNEQQQSIKSILSLDVIDDDFQICDINWEKSEGKDKVFLVNGIKKTFPNKGLRVFFEKEKIVIKVRSGLDGGMNLGGKFKSKNVVFGSGSSYEKLGSGERKKGFFERIKAYCYRAGEETKDSLLDGEGSSELSVDQEEQSGVVEEKVEEDSSEDWGKHLEQYSYRLCKDPKDPIKLDEPTSSVLRIEIKEGKIANINSWGVSFVQGEKTEYSKYVCQEVKNFISCYISAFKAGLLSKANGEYVFYLNKNTRSLGRKKREFIVKRFRTLTRDEEQKLLDKWQNRSLGACKVDTPVEENVLIREFEINRTFLNMRYFRQSIPLILETIKKEDLRTQPIADSITQINQMINDLELDVFQYGMPTEIEGNPITIMEQLKEKEGLYLRFEALLRLLCFYELQENFVELETELKDIEGFQDLKLDLGTYKQAIESLHEKRDSQGKIIRRGILRDEFKGQSFKAQDLQVYDWLENGGVKNILKNHFDEFVDQTRTRMSA